MEAAVIVVVIVVTAVMVAVVVAVGHHVIDVDPDIDVFDVLVDLVKTVRNDAGSSSASSSTTSRSVIGRQPFHGQRIVGVVDDRWAPALGAPMFVLFSFGNLTVSSEKKGSRRR